jgi:hypothetical protein
MTDKLTGNGSEALFAKRLVLLTQLAGLEHDIAKDAWESGNLSDREYGAAVNEYVRVTQQLQKQLQSWQEVQQ